MNIAILVHRFPPYLGGAEMYSRRLAQGLQSLGHQVTVYTTRHPERREDGIKTRELKNINPPGSGYFFWPAFFKPSVFRELKNYDVIHAVDFSMFAALAGLIASRVYSKPSALTAFYHPPSAMPHPWLKSWYDKTVGRFILSGYSAMIIHSTFELEALSANVGELDQQRLYRIPSGPIIEGIKPRYGFRERYGLADKHLVLYVGRIDSNKGADHLLHAINKLKNSEEAQNLALAIVGEEESWHRWSPDTVRLIKEMEDRVFFIGKLFGEELAAAYAESDALIVPSKYESYGLTLVEALSYGTPVIATRVGIAPEVIKDGYNGYLYNYGNAEMLAESILKLKDLDKSELRQNASDSVRDFTWDRTLRDITDLYYSLVKVPNEQLL